MAETSDFLVLVEPVTGDLKSSHGRKEAPEVLEFLSGGLNGFRELGWVQSVRVEFGQRDLEASERAREGRLGEAGDMHFT